MQRITNKKEFLKAVFYEGYNNFETLQEALLTHGFGKITQNGHTREGRETWLVVGTFYFCEISCNKNFTNIRFFKKPPKIRFLKKPPKIKELNEIKEKIEKTGGTYVPGSEGFFNNKRVQQFFTIVDNIPVTYWVNEEGEIYGIEAV